MNKAIFFDLDGTLLDCHNGIRDITPGVKRAIRKLQEEGDYIFVASGRPYAFISKALLDFGFNGFIFTNGTRVVVEDKVIYRRTFDKAFVKRVVPDFERLGIQYMLQGEKDSYLREEFKGLYSYYYSFGISGEYIKGRFDINGIDVYKMDMLCPDEDAVGYCMSLRTDEYDYIYNPIKRIFEFYFKMDTKASGIMKVLKYLNIPVENSYSFGDDKNDIEMLEEVGCGIAMGNARDEVKKHAKRVTDTVQNDGVASGIERFILSA